MSRKFKRRKDNKSKAKQEKGRVVPRTRRKVQIEPRNPSQQLYCKAMRNHDITFGIGSAGTGKTYLAALMAMHYITEGLVDKIVICRPAIPAGGENIGFLPGDIEEKMNPYLRPIFDAMLTYWSPQTIQTMMHEGKIEIVPLAFMRGRTFANTFVLADEIQNGTNEQLLMLITRLGEGSKMVITGDPVQSDIRGESCLNLAMKRLSMIDTISFVEFNINDVVRHPTVAMILKHWPTNAINYKPPEVISSRKALIA